MAIVLQLTNPCFKNIY